MPDGIQPTSPGASRATVLTPDQRRALDEILDARALEDRHLLTGYAGTGKTTLMQAVVREFRARGLDVALTAPTHKAVAVLSRKLAEAGITGVDCRTIHSLLSLKPKTVADRQVFERSKKASPVLADVVVVDECSMLGADLMAHIRRYLPRSFVLLVGDPAQLPPVGEEASQSFGVRSRSHLDTIVRQGADNPVLAAATAIRASQGSEADWSWCRPAAAPPLGVFLPGDPDGWLRRAFTSDQFEADPDAFRYLAWTNDRVAAVNAKVRRWRYGDNIPTPMMPGERALIRGPIVRDEQILFNTNEEATVAGIEADRFVFRVREGAQGTPGWTVEFPSWRVVLRDDDGAETPVHMLRDTTAYQRAVARITDEAAEDRSRWGWLHALRSALANLQSIYAMTVHTSQGSTFGNAFVDVADIRRRGASNLLEMQQLLYVAATRPSRALILVNA